VLVLLPPSEGKTAPAAGGPVDLAALAFPALTPVRERLLDKLEHLGSVAPARARKALGLSAGQVDEVARDAALRTAPAAPAGEVYTGVLFERLRLPELPPAARERVLIASALWGVTRPDDRIPAYRLSMGATLPRIPSLAGLWRPALARALPDAPGLVLDLRSGPYAAAWRPRHATVVGVRGFTERPDGSRAVISHMAKRVRGDVARIVLGSDAGPASRDDVLDLVRAAGLRAEPGDGGTVDVIEASRARPRPAPPSPSSSAPASACW
jgi:cytoplasmic iron level regulating protein YaaA (DUF328/UPF0246 family)